MNTRLPPAQVVVDPVIETAGTSVAVIVIAGVLAVAVAGLAQASLLVMDTLTTSPLFNVEEVKVGFVSPATGLPFTDH